MRRCHQSTLSPAAMPNSAARPPFSSRTAIAGRADAGGPAHQGQPVAGARIAAQGADLGTRRDVPEKERTVERGGRVTGAQGNGAGACGGAPDAERSCSLADVPSPLPSLTML